MIDRLISGAGAVSDRVDRSVRTVLPGTAMADQPASLLVAGLLGVLALVLAVVGLESSGSSTLRTLDPSTVTADALSNRTWTTMHGRVLSTYVGWFPDLDMDGEQDPGEVSDAWDYFLVGPGSPAGVVVRSERSPDRVFRLHADGVVVRDPAYVRDTLDALRDEVDAAGLQVDTETYIDARSAGDGPVLDLATALPGANTSVTVDAARLTTFTGSCSDDRDGDGVCGDGEFDLWDVVAYDPVTRHGVVVLLPTDPTYQDATFTGVLHRDAATIADALADTRTTLEEGGVTVSDVLLLTDGASPADPLPIILAAIAAALVVGVLLLGVLGGYVRYRPGDALPAGGRTLASDGRLALAVTGVLRTPTGRVHVREAAADLVRFVLVAPPATDDEPTVEPGLDAALPTTLIVERRDRPEGVAVGRGELTAIGSGTLTTFRARRPALRLEAGTGRVYLSFDDVASRDRAAAELIHETGVGATPVNAPTEVS